MAAGLRISMPIGTKDGQEHLGHLLPHTLSIAAKSRISGHGLKGARFEADLDPETEFTLFRVRPDPNNRFTGTANAVITTLAPFEDLHDSISGLAETLGWSACDVAGLGSFAGAAFLNGAPMGGLISEILLQRGAGSGPSGDLTLPVRCVDLDGKLHCGAVQPGKAPTLVTCELLIRRRD